MRRSRRQPHKHEQQKRRPTTAWTSQEAAEEADEKEADEKEAAEDAAEEKWAWWGRAATTRALSWTLRSTRPPLPPWKPSCLSATRRATDLDLARHSHWSPSPPLQLTKIHTIHEK